MSTTEPTTIIQYHNPIVNDWAALEICRALWDHGELGPDRPPPEIGKLGMGRCFSGTLTMDHPPFLTVSICWFEDPDGWTKALYEAYGSIRREKIPEFLRPNSTDGIKRLVEQHEHQCADRWVARGPGHLVHLRRAEG